MSPLLGAQGYQSRGRSSVALWYAPDSAGGTRSGVDREEVQLRRESVLWAVVLAAVAVLFVWITGAKIVGGVGHADDAWFAVTAKTLASGQGFARPINSDELVQWDPLITTGPPMVALAALLVGVLGALDELPGALVLVTFVVQVALACVLLLRRYSLAATLAFGATLICLLMLMSTQMWFFGVGIGECFAFGFVMLSVVALATMEGRLAVCLAGLFAGLAIATKLIALFPILGIGFVYALAIWREQGRRSAFSLSVAFGLGAAIPVGLIELSKLATLGLPAYLDYWPAVASITNVPGNPPDEFIGRFSVFFGVIDTDFVPLYALSMLVIGGALLAWRTTSAPKAEQPRSRLTALALGAATGHFMYVVLLSTLYNRYFWIGMALVMLSLATLILMARPRARVAAFASILGLAVVTGTAGNWLTLDRYAAASSQHAERLNVVALTEARPATPFVAQAQTSLYDIVYLRGPSGPWSFGRDIARHQGQPVIAVVNHEFTSKASDFYRIVHESCSTLTPRQQFITAFDCGTAFWEQYLPRAALSPVPDEWMIDGLAPGARCNIEVLDGHEELTGPITVRDPANLWMFGWAADQASGSSPSATYVVVQGPGDDYYAPVVLENRPGLAQALGGPAFEGSAFRVSIDATSVPHGKYQVGLVTHTNGQLRKCSIAVTFVV